MRRTSVGGNSTQKRSGKQTSLLSFFRQATPSQAQASNQAPFALKQESVVAQQDQSVHEDENSVPASKRKITVNDIPEAKRTKQSDAPQFKQPITPLAKAAPSQFNVPTSTNKFTPVTQQFKVPSSAVSSGNKSQQTPRSVASSGSQRSLLSSQVDEKPTKQYDGKYAWLNDIRDASGNRLDDEDYDKRTLFVPRRFYQDCSPFEKQYWEVKSMHYDTVVFFKKGKFYELFFNDADLANRLFDLKLTDRGVMRMAGVPESSFDATAAKFIAKGYKVSKVEQMESLLGKELRKRDSLGGAKAINKKDDIVRRELTAILTTGTLTDLNLIGDEMSNYCVAIKEMVTRHADGVHYEYGVALVDASTSKFHVCHLQDDKDRSMLETLLVQTRPREVLYEKGRIDAAVIKMVKLNLDAVTTYNALASGVEFWDAGKTQDELQRFAYFKDGMPQCLTDANPLVTSAFGALVWYLRSLKLDQQLLGVGQFSKYDSIMLDNGSLVLDGQTLINLEILKTTDGGTDGSLFSLLNKCSTASGKRLFKQWLCHPLCNTNQIEDRLDAIDDFNEMSVDIDSQVIKPLRKCPDLERMLSRAHAGSCKLKDFLVILDSYATLTRMFSMLSAHVDANELKSTHLRQLLQQFPVELVMQQLEIVKGMFDMDKARQGEFVIHRGVEVDFDQLLSNHAQCVTELESHLVSQRRDLKCAELKFKDVGKEIYQIEVPVAHLSKVPRDWVKKSGTKNVSRYYSPFLLTQVRVYQELQERKLTLTAQLFGRVLARFDEHYAMWKQAVAVVAEFDALLSLARVSVLNGGILGECCRPQFVDMSADNSQVLEIKQMTHPCVVACSERPFVANDLVLGGGDSKSSMILLTGANMGGKSTILRQTCILIIMAQLGCWVPAQTMRLTLFDRVFTRIGANDNILAGQSTFMVELAETSKILKYATNRSLVILDELGRGTGTLDGFSIAYSVLNHLANKIKCLGMFSTHYGQLTREFAMTEQVRCMHMATRVNDVNDRDVTFLYKLIDGVSPKSYGMNVARMAGLPQQVIDRAEHIATTMATEIGTATNGNELNRKMAQLMLKLYRGQSKTVHMQELQAVLLQ